MSWFSKVSGSLVGGVLGLVGANKANKQQASQFAQNYELAHDQLYKQHQIEVADLKAAGLNPILSANGGNSTFGASSGGSYENLGTAATSGYMAASRRKIYRCRMKLLRLRLKRHVLKLVTYYRIPSLNLRRRLRCRVKLLLFRFV